MSRDHWVAALCQGIVVLVAYAYLLALLLLAVTMRYFASDYWMLALPLYAPRVIWLAPIFVIALALWIAKRRRHLWTQAVATGVVLFPIMGLVLPSVPIPTSDGQRLRILSFNVNSGFQGADALAREITRIDPDLAFIQEAKGSTDTLIRLLKSHYRFVQARPYSLVFSKFPVVETTDHPKIAIRDWPRSPRFQRHVIKLPSGPLAIYNVHPISPRGTLNLTQFRGAFHAIRTGQAINQESTAELEYNLELRRRQVEAVGESAGRETIPVLLAGDFNLPDLSQVFLSNLGQFKDAFLDQGAGFGYTFPARFPWMRLDRVLASYDLHFIAFDVGCTGLSDHRCVIAQVQVDGS